MDFGFALPFEMGYWFVALAVAGLAALAFALRTLERRRDTRLARFVELHLAPRLVVGHNARLRSPLFWLTLFGFVFIVLAIAQPHWGQKWETVTKRSHDILVCLDTSESMRAENPLPSRLERAKQKIVSILDRTPGDRFGLIAFAGSAELMCPLTLDRGYFRSVLSAVDTDSISLKGTDIALALEEAIDSFREEDTNAKNASKDSRAILLISDGEQVSGNAIALAKTASEFAHVFVIGVGDPRGTEITFADQFGRRATVMSAGQPHLSKLDEETLRDVAMAGGGGYIRTTADNTDVEAIYGFIEQLAAADVSSDVRLQLVNRYQWPLTAAIICFALEGLWIAVLPWLRKKEDATAEFSEEKSYA